MAKFKEFFIPIIIVFISFILAAVLGIKLVNNVEEMINYRSDVTKKEQTLKEKKEALDKKAKQEAEEAKKLAETASRSKPFYKPAASGMNTEGIIAGEFTEILELVRANKIKIRSIKYDYNPSDDAFVKGAGGRYKAARLNMEMISDYTSYNSFLKELYKHEHFLDIQSVEIVPYRKNKQILLINFKLKLYAQQSE